MPPQFWRLVVVPIMATGMPFIGITTPGKDLNFVGRLIALRTDDGKPVFHTVALEFVCNSCRQKGKADTCRHMSGQLPRWHDENAHRDIEVIMSDQADDHAREMKGIHANENTTNVFHEKHCMRLLDPRNFHMSSDSDRFRHIFISLDPAAGTSASSLAIVSCAYTHGGTRCIVLGMESAKFGEVTECIDLLVRHIRAVSASFPGADTARKIFVPESNLGYEAQHYALALQRHGFIGDGYCVMNEDRERTGVRMNNEFKKNLMYNLKYFLEQHSVSFHQKMLCLSKKPDDMRHELVNQLLAFARIIVPSKNIYKPPTEIFSGKEGRGSDDHVIALSLNVSMQRVFWGPQAEKYKKWH